MLISNLPEPYKALAEFFRAKAGIPPTAQNYDKLNCFDWEACTGLSNPSHGKFWGDVYAGTKPSYLPIGILSYYENKSGKRLDYVPGSITTRVDLALPVNLGDFIVDEEASSEDKIVLIKKPAALPKSWDDLGHISGFWTESASGIRAGNGFYSSGSNKNLFDTKEQAEASIALAQLSQLRKVYRQGWEPCWVGGGKKWCIYPSDDKLHAEPFLSANHFLSFQSKEVAELFIENFEDLIKKALPLMS